MSINLLTLSGLSANISADKPSNVCRKVYGQVKNLLSPAGLETVFGVARPNVTNLLTLAGLWTLFG